MEKFLTKTKLLAKKDMRKGEKITKTSDLLNPFTYVLSILL